MNSHELAWVARIALTVAIVIVLLAASCAIGGLAERFLFPAPA
jgi:hypothetical protein